MESELLNLKDLIACIIAGLLLFVSNKCRILSKELKQSSIEPKKLCNDCEKCLYYQTYNNMEAERSEMRSLKNEQD